MLVVTLANCDVARETLFLSDIEYTPSYSEPLPDGHEVSSNPKKVLGDTLRSPKWLNVGLCQQQRYGYHSAPPGPRIPFSEYSAKCQETQSHNNYYACHFFYCSLLWLILRTVMQIEHLYRS